MANWLDRLWRGLDRFLDDVDANAGEVLAAWARDGWLVHPLIDVGLPELPLKVLQLLGGRAGPRDSRLVVELFDSLQDKLFERGVERISTLVPPSVFAERSTQFGDITWAYSEQRFSIVPGPSYSLAEGVLRDVTGTDLDSIFTRRDDRRQAVREAMSLPPRPSWMPVSAYRSAQQRSVLASLDLLSQPSSAPHVTRHRVMHGEPGAVSQEESVRALLFLLATLALKSES